MSWLSFAVFFTIGWACWTYTIGTAIHEWARPKWWDEHPARRLPVAIILGCWTMALLTAAVFGVWAS